MMQTRFSLALRSVAALIGVGALVSAPVASSAGIFKFVYTGSFSSADALNLSSSATSYFTGDTPFTATAYFDNTSPNIASLVGVPGFVAYSPTSATLEVGGHSYKLATYNQDPTNGVTVSIFDDTTPFGPGHYAAGFLQNPLADGAGFIGDFVSASPSFSASKLKTTTFTKYEGVGYGSGPDFGAGPTVAPIPLSNSTGDYVLTLGNYDEVLARGGTLNTARLIDVPEPGSLALLAGMGVTGAGLLLRRRRNK